MHVADEERLSRFLFSSKWFAATTGRVKPEAFLPHPRIELSVSCTESLKESTIWEIGQSTAAAHSQKPNLHGRADVCARVFRSQGLEIRRDDQPMYHANITGWQEDRSAQISKAQQIAAEAKLQLNRFLPPR